MEPTGVEIDPEPLLETAVEVVRQVLATTPIASIVAVAMTSMDRALLDGKSQSREGITNRGRAPRPVRAGGDHRRHWCAGQPVRWAPAGQPRH
jgi:sugar (pentulose or hexulose) kinase